LGHAHKARPPRRKVEHRNVVAIPDSLLSGSGGYRKYHYDGKTYAGP
jgi:hypothetical protein